MERYDNSGLQDLGLITPDSFSLDPSSGGTYRGKPIWTADDAGAYLNRTGYDWYTDNYGELNDGVLNFGFWANYEELVNSYYVNTDGSIAFNEAYFGGDFSPFTAGQQALAREAIALWDDLIAISFKETKSYESDITYGNTYTGGAQAYAYLPFGSSEDDFYALFGFEETGRLGGDVWIDGFVASNFFPLDDGYYAKTTMIHETGHALGLSHPGDYDALDDNDGDGVPDPITYANDAAYAQDSLQYSIMSYFDAYETGAQYIDWSLANFAYPSTPQVHDVLAIQKIYGADMTTRTGDTVYGFNSNANRAEFHFDLNTRPVVTIWDAGGNDTLDFSGWDTPSVIDLNEGAFSSGGGIEKFLTLEEVNANRAALGFAPRSEETWAFYEQLKADLGLTNGLFKDNIAIAYGAKIENAIGGGGDDLIIGNKLANKLTGGDGADTFVIKATGGKDEITDFSSVDILAVQNKINDKNNDGIITWKNGQSISLGGNNSVKLDGVDGTAGLRYLGTSDGLFYYGDAKVRPVASSNQKVYEGTNAAETVKGSTSATFTDVFFFDTAGKGPGLGGDKLTFTAKDLFVTTAKLSDSNNDGVVTFDGVLNLGDDAISIKNASGGKVRSLEFDGSVIHDGIEYFVYSTVGSSVGVSDVHFA